MPEETPKPDTAIVAADGQKRPYRKKNVSEKHFLQTIIVRNERGERLPVPFDAIANRNAAKVLVAKTREFIVNQMDAAKARELSSKEVADLVGAAKNVAEMSYKAYEGIEADLSAPAANASGAALTAYAVAQGVANGLAGGSNAANDLFSRLDSLAKRAGNAPRQVGPVVDIK